MALPYQAVLSAKSASELDAKRMPRPYVAAFTAPPVLAPYRSDDKPGNSYGAVPRSEEHTSELQSRQYLVCRLLLEKKERKLRLTPTQAGKEWRIMDLS